jgi:hypothetical protein
LVAQLTGHTGSTAACNRRIPEALHTKPRNVLQKYILTMAGEAGSYSIRAIDGTCGFGGAGQEMGGRLWSAAF